MKTISNYFASFAILVLVAGGLFLYIRTNPKQFSTALQHVVDTAQSIGTTTSAISDSVKKTVLSPGGLVAKIESNNSRLTHSGVITLTNKERNKVGLNQLDESTVLDEVASRRAKDMFAKQYFEHVSPSGDSASLEADALYYEYIVIGENIALGNFADDAELVAAWMASPGHKANILNTRYTEIGVSVLKGTYSGKQTWIAVQVFSRPLNLCKKVDESLKSNSQSKIDQLDALHVKATRLQSELKNANPQTQPEIDLYNQTVAEYNAVANQINILNAEVKSVIDLYNSQVHVFNNCIK